MVSPSHLYAPIQAEVMLQSARVAVQFPERQAVKRVVDVLYVMVLEHAQAGYVVTAGALVTPRMSACDGVLWENVLTLLVCLMFLLVHLGLGAVLACDAANACIRHVETCHVYCCAPWTGFEWLYGLCSTKLTSLSESTGICFKT